MILRGLEIAGSSRPVSDVAVSGGVVTRVGSAEARHVAAIPGETELDFNGAIASPGLVNSHDHLEFNLYPQLGHRKYTDYRDWGREIHTQDAKTIGAVEAVPRAVRLEWGALKNLLAGVTTTAHHASAADDETTAWLPIECIRSATSIHSLRRGGHWRWRLNGPWPKEPFVFHVGEGRSDEAAREADELIRWNIFRRELVAVHAVAMDRRQAGAFRAVVWCPVANDFLYGATADVTNLKHETAILFGTDSTLTAGWDFWSHLRFARAAGALSDAELFGAVTSAAASVWRLPRCGTIEEGARANLLVARKKHRDRWDAFFAIDPRDLLLVLHGGVVLLADASVKGIEMASPCTRICVNGCEKTIAGDMGRLLQQIQASGVNVNLPVTAT